MMPNEKPRNINFQADYAGQAHFCEVFEQEMDGLYLLAFLLTANHQKAEQCFAQAVDESFQETRVFKGWTQTWIKRCIIRTAIRIASPASGASTQQRDRWSLAENPTASEIDAITRLAPLDRFVFVMSVLERYTSWDCSLLLGVSVDKVASAQVRALRRLPDPASFFLGVEGSQLQGMRQATA